MRLLRSLSSFHLIVSMQTNQEHLRDHVAQALLTAILYTAAIWICLYASDTIADPDIWWHLRSAEWIIQHHRFPHTDPFSTFGAGKPWQAYSWLYELVVLQLYRWFGLSGIMLYTCTMVVAITAAIQGMMRRLQPDFTKAVLLSTTLMIGMSRLYTPRPWLCTMLFFALEIDILVQTRRTGKTRRLLWLPLIFILWANTHIQFVDGLLLLAVACAEPAFTKYLTKENVPAYCRKLWIVSAVCVLCTLANPYGIGIYQAAYQLASQAGVMNKVSELQAIPFRSLGDFLVLFLTMGAAGALVWNRRLQPFATVLLGIAGVVSFRSQRDVWFVAIVAGFILAETLPGRELPGSQQFPYPSPLTLAVTAALAIVGVLAFHVNNQRLQVLLAREMPVHAVDAVKARGYSGPLYNDYSWGGYMIWSLRMPVSIDGRAALHGDKRIDRSVATWQGEPSWASDPELSSADLVIAPVKAPLAQLLKMDPRFGLVFHDEVADVFVARKQALNAASPLAKNGSAVASRPCDHSSQRGTSCAS
jgi:hypothetical protein